LINTPHSDNNQPDDQRSEGVGGSQDEPERPTIRRNSLAEHIAGQAPALGDDGPIGRLDATLRAATPEERQIIKDGLALLLRFADMEGEYRLDIAYWTELLQQLRSPEGSSRNFLG